MSLPKISLIAYSHISDAATCGSIPLLEAALKRHKKATPDHALMTACCGGWINMVKWLIEHGANPNATDKSGKSALYWIISGDGWSVGDEDRANPPEHYVEILEYMISKGMRLNTKEIMIAKEQKNSNYEHLKPSLDKYDNAAKIIQRQMYKSRWDPKYKMCRNIFKKGLEKLDEGTGR